MVGFVSLLETDEGTERARRFYVQTGWQLVWFAGTHDVGGAQVGIVRYELAL